MKKQRLFIVSIILGIIILAFGAVLLINALNKDVGPEINTSITVSGIVMDVFQESDVLSLESGDQMLSVAFGGQTEIYSDTGTMISGSDIYPGFEITVTGTVTTSNTNIKATRIVVESAPAIVVTKPQAGDVITSDTIEIGGSARVFENTFTLEIETEEGEKILSQPVMTNAADAGEFGTFERSIVLPVESIGSKNLVFRFFEASARDGSETHLVEIPVKLGNTQTTTVRVFLVGPENQGNCSAVVSRERVIPYTQGVARAALEELFDGVTTREQSDGYTTSIPSGVEIISLSITNGEAYVVLSDDLEKGVGGSCRVSSIRAQIQETLTQFPSVDRVRIQVENKTEEETLQP